MTYLFLVIATPALAVAAAALSVTLGRRNARTEHDPGEPLPPTRHARLVRMPDAMG